MLSNKTRKFIEVCVLIIVLLIAAAILYFDNSYEVLEIAVDGKLFVSDFRGDIYSVKSFGQEFQIGDRVKIASSGRVSEAAYIHDTYGLIHSFHGQTDIRLIWRMP